MRIGLFGGTFNPIHIGHLRAAVEVREAYHLDEIWLIPAAVPPLKTGEQLAPATDRLEMVRAAAGSAGFRVSEIELQRSGPSYSVDTLQDLQQTLPAQTQLFLIIGADAFLDIHTWKSYQRIFSLVPLIVMVRPGTAASHLPAVVDVVGRCLAEKVATGYAYQPARSAFVHARRQPVFITAVTQLQISATHIRELVAAGRSIRFLVPDPVAAIIARKGLYR